MAEPIYVVLRDGVANSTQIEEFIAMSGLRISISFDGPLTYESRKKVSSKYAFLGKKMYKYYFNAIIPPDPYYTVFIFGADEYERALILDKQITGAKIFVIHDHTEVHKEGSSVIICSLKYLKEYLRQLTGKGSKDEKVAQGKNR